MSIIDMNKSSYRQDVFERAGLGDYGPDNDIIRSLVQKGLAKVSGKSVRLNKKKAKEAMKASQVPSKYKQHLDNWSMQFGK